MPHTAFTISIYGGLAVAAFARILFGYGWRRLTVPRGRHQHRNRHERVPGD